eukprot:CAMPEP_0206631130 /NCGR_PEP_ID=MMETSP0325_2-20121206/67992_1 /ASSEMBLY_ACC=CAM_ASM_000347 /TAXON_ID=2866 /ORGANISM="Crypthecodinium cohnii, Strain Seligo" /LENGTH=40 /DNA_ID= /DNA_START= /DNA_END= /DNA_ORIENTATION=
MSTAGLQKSPPMDSHPEETVPRAVQVCLVAPGGTSTQPAL